MSELMSRDDAFHAIAKMWTTACEIVAELKVRSKTPDAPTDPPDEPAG